MTPSAVLLVPAEGDPMGLLAAGVCGARPPVAEFRTCRSGHATHGAWRSGPMACDHPDHPVGRLRPLLVIVVARALVLAWDGQPVVEGIDRLARVSGLFPESVESAVGELLTGSDAAREIAREMSSDREGTLILLDPTGAVLP